MVAQGISIPLSASGTGHWRIIPLVSAGIALVQIGFTSAMIESPFWLAEKRKNDRVYDTPDDDEEFGSRRNDEEAGEFSFPLYPF